MHITKFMKRERSGLAFTTLEMAKFEELRGHSVCVKEPSSKDNPIVGQILCGEDREPDIITIHSQLEIAQYFGSTPRIMVMHGEPLSSVGNGISMKAIVDLAPKCDAFICMRKEEWPIWNSIKRTHLVDKGVDLGLFRPLDNMKEKLSGSPAVLYCENWRGQRNPLYLCAAMEIVWQRYPEARLHLYNCSDKRMFATFKALSEHNKWWPFLRSLSGHVDDVVSLYNKADIVVSCLDPLFARTIPEALACGKAAVCPGYRGVGEYPFVCRLEAQSMAHAIMAAWEATINKQFDFRAHAERHHSAETMAKQCEDVYLKYL